MFLNLKDCSIYLEMSEDQLKKLVFENRIKYHIVDGEILINGDQFDTHIKQKEVLKEYAKHILSLEIEESVDYKDED
ncbi:MAG: hypothetical protein WBO70_06135 [Erysipelotrichaceae bacterium]